MNKKMTARTSVAMLFLVGIFTHSLMAQSEIYQTALKESFPAAKNVKWEMDDGYMTAEFLDELNQEVEVWYDRDANWVRTKTELFFRNLPRRIKQAYEDSPYAKWRVDDVEFIQKVNEESYYMLEVEKGEQEHKLFISEKGVILKR